MIDTHFNGIPLHIASHPLMTKRMYANTSAKFGFTTVFKDMKHSALGSFDVYMNACYGHRHWIVVLNGRIYGLTIGHTGWIVEKPMWERVGKCAGFTTRVVEVPADPYPLRYVQIHRSVM